MMTMKQLDLQNPTMLDKDQLIEMVYQLIWENGVLVSGLDAISRGQYDGVPNEYAESVLERAGLL